MAVETAGPEPELTRLGKEPAVCSEAADPQPDQLARPRSPECSHPTCKHPQKPKGTVPLSPGTYNASSPTRLCHILHPTEWRLSGRAVPTAGSTVLGASEGWHGAPETPFLCILCVLWGWAEGSALPREPSLACLRPTSGRPVMASQEESAHQHDPGTWDLGSVQPLLAWWGTRRP